MKPCLGHYARIMRAYSLLRVLLCFLNLQVVHGVLQRAHRRLGHGVAGAAAHEHVAEVLVEDDLLFNVIIMYII